MTIPIEASDFLPLDELEAACRACRDGEALDFKFSYAYQPIVDVNQRTVFAHEALVRGPNGEGAHTVLSRLDEHNRYRFDQACRVKAIKGAALLGLSERLSINFLPNAIYKPEVCIRTTLEAARAHQFPVERIIFEATEGEVIETPAERDFLIDEGVSLMQGYLFCRPAFEARGVIDPMAWPGPGRSEH
jgi:EAL domain-containing protein (putative c-di-GMP-specific phosphodiesterase class I)